MVKIRARSIVAITLGAALATGYTVAYADGWNPGSRASNQNSIEFTRHNMTQSYNPNAAIMDPYRNNYGEICVYCHTPHGANRQIAAPLWNRTIQTSQYTIYDKPRTYERPIGQPGPNSLTCLSCHDGTISIDSIINMPGSGNYDPTQQTKSSDWTQQNTTFLNSWPNAAGTGHFVMGPDAGTIGQCTMCHQAAEIPTSALGSFTVFTIGTDLRDDHPIGILYPTDFSGSIDFNPPTRSIPGRMAFFDLNGNNHADSNEVRLYDSGDGYEVECASCHDPHGVPSGGVGSKFNPSFLRVNNGVTGDHAGAVGIVSNTSSALCLTCHLK